MEIHKWRLRFTIGTKLVSLIAILLISSTLTLVWLSTRMFIESDTALIQQTNADSATHLATQMREVFQALTDKMRILGTLMSQSDSPSKIYQEALLGVQSGLKINTKSQLISEFFSKDKDLLAVYLEKTSMNKGFALVSSAISPEMREFRDPTGERSFIDIQNLKDLSLYSVAQGAIDITSLLLSNDEPALVVAIPFILDSSQNKAFHSSDHSTFSHILIALVRQNRFIKAFSESEIVNSFMVDRKGKLLAHPHAELVTSRENFSNLAIVKQMLEGKFNNGQTQYIDPQTHEAKLGAFRLVGFGGLGVVAEVAEAKAFEAAKKVEYRAMLIGCIVLCISFLVGYLYSQTITLPIRRLSDAAMQIARGNFRIQLVPKGKDEIAHLSVTFNHMAVGLAERDRVKELFNKFHNKEIAEKLLTGEVKLGGERKTATVFFSDIRGFTGMSESLEPEQVVEMLNEYMTRMVTIIRSHGGVVDKYVGDAIMALWGVPLNGKEDCYHAVQACLEMRSELAQLNALRLSRGQGVLRIGMGLNSGPLIAGNIGSNEKMEYTVIGDAVNLASRIESMTKEYGTDLLISKSIYHEIKDRFIFEYAGATRVKGKGEPIEVYKVLGYYNQNKEPVIIATDYSTYAAEKSDKVVHDKLPQPPLVTPPPPPQVMSFQAKPPTPPPFRIKK